MQPQYIANPNRLSTLRKRASFRALMRAIESGAWGEVLLKLKKTSHRFKDVANHEGELNALLVKVNSIRLGIRVHATVLTGKPISVGVPEGFDAQSDAIAMIRKRSAFDALLSQCARRANIESEATLRVAIDPDHGVVICSDRNSEVLAVGPDGPDMQPTVYERRWIIERTINNAKVKFLRVERHRAPGGVGVIEQEAYRTKTTDLYIDLTKLTRVQLSEAVPGTTLEERYETGVSVPLITRLVCEYYDGWPEFLLSESDIDLLDTNTAAFSRVARSLEQHGQPKARVGSGLVNDNNEVVVSEDAIVDDEKTFEYISPDYDFASMLEFFNKTMAMLLGVIQVSPALVGIKLEGGAMPETYDKLRLEGTNTLSRAKTSSRYFTPALERALTAASIIDAKRPMSGYAVGEVSVQMFPELPRDRIDIAREAAELLAGDGKFPLIDHRTAVEMVNESGADAIMDRIEEDQAKQAQRDQASLAGAFGVGGAA